MTSRRSSLFIFIIIIFSSRSSMNNADAMEFGQSSIENPRLTQKIVVEPENVVAHLGQTVELPCIVWKESDAIVTWCWNDFCTLGKTQFVRQVNSSDGPISIYQYSAYPRFQLRINERLNHYNLSITHVSNGDEGVFQCQIQRTMRAFEARSRRVQLTLMTPPNSPPLLEFADFPLRQGESTNFTCSSSTSRPAPILNLYKNEEKLIVEQISSSNQTQIVFFLSQPSIEWDEATIRCEQIYPFVNVSRQSISKRIRIFYKPKVRIESQNRNALTVNSSATFRCVATGNPEAKIRWFANSIDLSSLTSPIIKIPLSKNVHNHTIGCSATNEMGTTNSTIRLLIRYPPIIFVRPPKFVVVDLQKKSTNPSVVRCLVDSFPRAKISWFYHGEIVAIGSTFHLTNITKRQQQGVYSYRIESEGFETLNGEFIVHVKGRPLIFLEESKENRRAFECRVYSSTPILKIMWKFNDESIESVDRSSISTVCNEYSCISKLLIDHQKFSSSSTSSLSHLLCVGENQFGVEQSLLYQIDTNDDFSFVLISIIFICFVLIVVLSIVAVFCCCRRKKTRESTQTQMPIVFDEHYSINELIKEVGSFRTCNTDSNESATSILPSDNVDFSFYKMNV